MQRVKSNRAWRSLLAPLGGLVFLFSASAHASDWCEVTNAPAGFEQYNGGEFGPVACEFKGYRSSGINQEQACLSSIQKRYPNESVSFRQSDGSCRSSSGTFCGYVSIASACSESQGRYTNNSGWSSCVSDSPCEPPPPPPPESACAGYPPGWEEAPITIGTGENAVTNFVCTKFFEPHETQDCSVDPNGYVRYNQTDYIACEDKLLECVQNGGDWGIFNEVEFCIPPSEAFPEDTTRPDCPDGVLRLENAQDGSGGSWQCITPMEPWEPGDVPGNEKHSDIDGDGIPDHLDNDMDGDGIPNDQDTDADGDGTPDSEQEGPIGGDGEDSVKGGSGCEVRPSCKGDAILCSINYQVWASRCKDQEKLTEDQPEDNPGELDLSPEGDLMQALDAAIFGLDESGEEYITGTGNQAIDGAVSSLENAITGILPNPGACADIVLNFVTGPLTISCAKLATFRDIVGWALYILTAWHLFTLATTPIQGRV